MKYTDLPFPGTNNEKARAEVAAAVNRVDQAKGGGAQELTNCLQAAIDHLESLNPAPFPVVYFYFDDDGSPYNPSESYLHYMSFGETYTPTFLLGIDESPLEPVDATDARLGSFQVGQPGGGYGDSNDYFEIDAETGVITAIGDAETPAPSDLHLITFRREIIVESESDEIIGIGYATAYIDWLPVE